MGRRVIELPQGGGRHRLPPRKRMAGKTILLGCGGKSSVDIARGWAFPG
jgi:hypothetical protein